MSHRGNPVSTPVSPDLTTTQRAGSSATDKSRGFSLPYRLGLIVSDSTSTSATITSPDSGKHIIRGQCVKRTRNDRPVGPALGRATVAVP